MTFPEFFKAATGNSPYEYQCRLACGPPANSAKPDTLRGGTDCHSQLIKAMQGNRRTLNAGRKSAKSRKGNGVGLDKARPLWAANR
jgi:hypothetical protein